LYVPLGKLDAVAGGEGKPAVEALKLLIRAEPAAFAVNRARAPVQLGHVAVGVGEDETGFLRCLGNVARVAVEQFGAGLALCARPVNAVLLLIDAERGVIFAFGEILARAP